MDNMVRNQPRKAGPSQQGVNRPVAPKPVSNKGKMKQLLVGAGIGVLVALIGVLLWFTLTGLGQQKVMNDRYQAVFLDDGKVFFGRLQNTSGDYVTLEDAYYTQKQSSSSNEQTTLEASGAVNLVKVGEEIYGPENSMSIRADKILFWQNLTPDNQIVKAIKAQDK